MDRTLKIFILFLSICSIGNGQDFEDISPDPYIFESDRLQEPRAMASVGNGHVATTIYTDFVTMNGLYNGVKGDSHRARLPSFMNIRMKAGDFDVNPRIYSLNVQEGIFTEKFTTPDWEIMQKTFAHRNYHTVLMTQFQARPLTENPPPITLTLTPNHNLPATYGDIYWYPDKIGIPYETGTGMDIRLYQGETVQVEDEDFQRDNSKICAIHTFVPTTITFTSTVETPGTKYRTFFAAYNNECPESDARALAQRINNGEDEALINDHITKWKNVWDNGRIEVEGDLKLAKIINGCFYYILSSLPVTENLTNSPQNQFYGLSPGGLAFGTLAYDINDYQGHSFWDTEIWMYPTMLYFYPEKAREILNYRLKVLAGARDLARKTGFEGSRFPWESAFTGRETTPDCCPETKYLQIHNTGDIAFAIRQYIAATLDKDWLWVEKAKYPTNGCGLIREIAQFWASKAERNDEIGFYEIKNVMPPDEDNWNVDNSVYTNVIAGLSIYFAKYASCLCEEIAMTPIPDSWLEIAQHLKLLYDPENDMHPEFDGYDGSEIKQADVVLLGFPLMYPMNASTRRNDLIYYENKTRPNGPAMTWAMHTVGFVELEEVEKAEEIFQKSSQYVREPFKIWTEAIPPTLGAVNFITGMGGYLQSIISGWGGLRLHLESLEFIRPQKLPGTSTALKFIGLKYLGNTFDMEIDHRNFLTLRLTGLNSEQQLEVTSLVNGLVLHFNTVGISLQFNFRNHFKISSKNATNCPLPSDQIGQNFLEGSTTTTATTTTITTTTIITTTDTTDSTNTIITTDKPDSTTLTDATNPTTTNTDPTTDTNSNTTPNNSTHLKGTIFIFVFALFSLLHTFKLPK